MPAALSASTSENVVGEPTTLTASGLSAATDYVLTITHAAGTITNVILTTDGAGGFTYPFVPQAPGTVTFSVAPRAAAAEATLTMENVS